VEAGRDAPSLSWAVRDFGRRFNPDRSVSVSVHCTWRTSLNPHGGWLEPMALPVGSYHQGKRQLLFFAHLFLKKKKETSWGPDLDPVITMAFSTTCQLVVDNLQVANERAGEGNLSLSLFSLSFALFSDPLECESWALVVQLDPHPVCPLADSVATLLQCMSEAEGIKSIRDVLSNSELRLGRALLDMPSQDEVDKDEEREKTKKKSI
jgi:hypothetical protein